MKKIIAAIKAFFSSKSPATYAEIKKETIEEIYKIEPKVVVEEKPKKAKPKKKKPAKKKTNEPK